MADNRENKINDFNEKGCPVCRGQWLSGNFPREITINIERHARLHICDNCGTFWEQFERFPDTIDIESIKEHYDLPDELIEYARQRQKEPENTSPSI